LRSIAAFHSEVTGFLNTSEAPSAFAFSKPLRLKGGACGQDGQVRVVSAHLANQRRAVLSEHRDVNQSGGEPLPDRAHERSGLLGVQSEEDAAASSEHPFGGF
jgi:hypothetical protein